MPWCSPLLRRDAAFGQKVPPSGNKVVVLPHLQGGRTVQEAASCPVQACQPQHEAFRAISGNSCPSKTGAALLALGSAVLAQAMQVFELLEAMALSH